MSVYQFLQALFFLLEFRVNTVILFIVHNLLGLQVKSFTHHCQLAGLPGMTWLGLAGLGLAWLGLAGLGWAGWAAGLAGWAGRA